jgi:hypothetical protein
VSISKVNKVGLVIILAFVAFGTVSFISAIRYAKGSAAAGRCRRNLMQIEAAKLRWAMAHNQPTNAVPAWKELHPYLQHIDTPVCPAGGNYILGRLDQFPQCSLGGDHVLHYKLESTTRPLR